MAMFEIFLEKDKLTNNLAPPDAKAIYSRLDNRWQNETFIKDPQKTPISKLKDQVAMFDKIKEEHGISNMFTIATFHRDLLEQLLKQIDAKGLRIYLSASISTNNEINFEPIIVAVDSHFDDIVSSDTTSTEHFFCTTDSKCPPPDPPSICPKAKLLEGNSI